jgi:uncharacterized protein (DUF1330 family)
MWTSPTRAVPAVHPARPAAFVAFGGRFLARGGRSEAMEGRPPQRSVVIEFDSYEQALACYRSDLYQEAVAIARGWRWPR